MKGSDFDEKSEGYLIGKEFVIVLVVVASALSFSLGFFVGKSGRHEQASPLASVPQQEPVPVQQPALQPQVQQAPSPSLPQPQAAAPAESNSREAAQETPKTSSPPEPPQKPAAPVQQVSVKQEPAPPASQPASYAVQLGAFRSLNEAKACKAKYEKKGFKSYIVTVADKQKEKVYKVKTGDFSKRTDAEMLSVKLKKTEGLNAFVTLKNE